MKKNFLGFLKLNDARKLFLLIWIPLLIIMTYGHYYANDTLDKEVYPFEGKGVIKVPREPLDIIPGLFVIYLYSFFMYIIAGLEDIPYDRCRKI